MVVDPHIAGSEEVDFLLMDLGNLEAHQTREGHRSPLVGDRILLEGEDHYCNLVEAGEAEEDHLLLHSLFARSTPRLRGRLSRL